MDQKNQTWTKTKNLLFFILFPVLLVVLSYSYRGIEMVTEPYSEAKKQFEIAKDRNTSALNKIKEKAKGTREYAEYIKLNKEKKSAYSNVKKELGKQKVLGFKSMFFFMERFGRVCADILLGVWVFWLVTKFMPKQKNSLVYYGSITIVLAYLSTKFFILFWIFQKFQDYNLFSYILITFITSFVLIITHGLEAV